ncbi:hypothetical protein Pmani_032380 [Petrolisthes manimaculis]|uniref:Uncharacterized protein n=1 Tax=Petrolisthes manimaculis TaxID=1843537 RepID=A0AAE1NT69_9EUCA|nr:hypothetical protein Pmani_032380 [Petrolisthes manimaculis]
MEVEREEGTVEQEGECGWMSEMGIEEDGDARWGKWRMLVEQDGGKVVEQSWGKWGMVVEQSWGKVVMWEGGGKVENGEAEMRRRTDG